jgi:hypothetical protein
MLAEHTKNIEEIDSLGYGGPSGRMEFGLEFLRRDPRQCGLSKPGRPDEEHMIEGIMTWSYA